MLSRSWFSAPVSLAIASVLVVSTTPIYAADFGPASSVGSVNGVGTLKVRGVGVNEGTLFPGDQVRTGAKSYAKVVLLNGNKLELGSDTEIVVDRTNEQVRLALKAGKLAFTASSTPLVIIAGGYEVLPAQGATGNVGFLGSQSVGVHILTGNAAVQPPSGKKTVTLGPGGERTLNLKSGTIDMPLGQLASTAPGSVALPAIPSIPRAAAAPAGGLTNSMGVALLAIAGGEAALIGFLANRDNLTTAGTAAVAQNALTTANVGVTTATAVNANATFIANASAADKTELTNALSSINAAKTALTNLNAQIAAADTDAEIKALNGQLNTQIAALNAATRRVNVLIGKYSLTGINQIPEDTSFASPS